MKSKLLFVPMMLLAQHKDLSQEIANLMFQAPGAQPGHRPVHGKGIVCQGTFTASPEARSISRAAHFQGSEIPVTVRFSAAIRSCRWEGLAFDATLLTDGIALGDDPLPALRSNVYALSVRHRNQR